MPVGSTRAIRSVAGCRTVDPRTGVRFPYSSPREAEYLHHVSGLPRFAVCRSAFEFEDTARDIPLVRGNFPAQVTRRPFTLRSLFGYDEGYG